MSKQLVTNDKPNKLAMNMDNFDRPVIEAEDLIIPRILAMAGTSKLVQEGVAKVGEFRESMNGEIIGTIDKPFEFIPFKFEKLYFTQTMTKKFVRVESYSKDMPREFTDDKFGECFRMPLYQFFVLLPGNMAMPFILSFKSTSEKAGKKLFNQMFIHNQLNQLNPAAKVCSMGGKWVENDLGKFIVADVKAVRNSTEDELINASKWASTLNVTKAKADEMEE